MVVDDGTHSSKADVQDVDCMDDSKTLVLLNQSINCETDVQVTHVVFIKEACVIMDLLQFFTWHSFLTTNSTFFCHCLRKSKDSKFNKNNAVRNIANLFTMLLHQIHWMWRLPKMSLDLAKHLIILMCTRALFVLLCDFSRILIKHVERGF